MDKISAEERSRVMKAVRRKDTAPEMIVRRTLHSMGYRFRLHAKELLGTPDIVFRPRRKAIFVHGCFWHGHDCRASLKPSSRTEFWGPKISRNVERDRDRIEKLREAGWKVLVVWECETRTKRREALEGTLRAFLDAPQESGGPDGAAEMAVAG